MIRRFIGRLRVLFPLLVIGAATTWASISILAHRVVEHPPGTIVIRIGHWQLEAGVRDAIEAVAADYAKLHPGVRIVQDAIPDQVFPQWVNTQLLGGTAPDLVEAGGLMAPPLWLNLQRRYFVPLTRHFAEPNPYNSGTDLENIPLTQTLKGGNAVVPELQENMDISLSRVSVRLFYNRDLLRRLAGLDEPPHDLAAFLRLCEQIREKGAIPIVGSNYHFGMWNQLFDALTFSVSRVADFNSDGFVGSDENYAAFRQKLLDLSFPAFEARLQLIREVARHFQAGFAGLTREEGVLLFAQQRAVFMSTGLWEAAGLRELSADNFELGVMKFPEPARDDPGYGAHLEGPIYEDPRIVLGFGVTKMSRHPEVAIDFLLFMASQKQNERLNRMIGWVPNTVGAKPDPDLISFEPNLRGVYPAFDFSISGDTVIRWKQLYDLFAVDQIDAPGLAREFGAFYEDRGPIGFKLQDEAWRRGQVQKEQLRSLLRGGVFNAQGAGLQHLWEKYVNLAPAQEIVDHAILVALASGQHPVPPPQKIYTPAVIQKVRESLNP